MFVVFPSNWSNVSPGCDIFCYEEGWPTCGVDVPNKSSPKISSFDFDDVAGPFFDCPGPMIARFC